MFEWLKRSPLVSSMHSLLHSMKSKITVVITDLIMRKPSTNDMVLVMHVSLARLGIRMLSRRRTSADDITSRRDYFAAQIIHLYTRLALNKTDARIFGRHYSNLF